MNLPAKVSEIITVLNDNGYEAFVVGGCVRDTLMSRIPGDFDITTSATPAEVKLLFKRTVDTGVAHGTVTVLLGRSPFEVTTFRQDGDYFDHRRPSNVTFTTSLQDDLSRRDFTMNAIAYHPTAGYIDPFGGREDIVSRCIRCVGEPPKRFGEDALRMLRAVRFSGQLGFEIESATLAAITENAPTLAHVSAERVRIELAKLLISDGSDKFADLLSTGLWEAFDPISLPYFAAHFESLRKPIAMCDKTLHNRLALLLIHMDDGEIVRILKLLTFDNKTMKAVRILVSGINQEYPCDPYSVRKALGEFGTDFFNNIIYLKEVIASHNGNTAALDNLTAIRRQVEQIHKDKDAYTISALAINGNTLKDLGLAQGEQIGKTLDFLLEEVCRDSSLKTLEHLTSLSRSFASN